LGHGLYDDQVLQLRQGKPNAVHLNPYRPGDGVLLGRQGTENDIWLQAGWRRSKAMSSNIFFKRSGLMILTLEILEHPDNEVLRRGK
jgi:hypothetical protein